MQDKENEWQFHQDGTQNDDEPFQIPSSLLPNVLHRLGLSREQKSPEQSLDDLLLQLRSTSWEERTLALRALGRLEQTVSLDLLLPFLQDKDITVRATTVDVLGTISRQVPLHWLVEALHDTNWHVREAAVFALAKQGTRAPREVLMTALHDKDGSVREAASLVLHQRSFDETSFTLYGQLREEISMQHKLYNPVQANGKNNGHTSDGDWNGAFMEYSGNTTQTHAVNEQMQAYAVGYQAPYSTMTQESTPEEYAEEVRASHNEKVTSYRLRGRSHKRWWIATLIITAILFFALGRLSTMILPQSLPVSGVKSVTVGSNGVKKPDNAFLIIDPNNNPIVNDNRYAPVMQDALSNAFHLTSPQILEQVKQFGSLNAVAARQGVSSSQLYAIELDAFSHIMSYANSMGNIYPPYATSMQDQFKNDNALREKLVLKLLSITANSKSTTLPG